MEKGRERGYGKARQKIERKMYMEGEVQTSRNFQQAKVSLRKRTRSLQAVFSVGLIIPPRVRSGKSVKKKRTRPGSTH